MVDDQQIKTGEPGDHIIGSVIGQGGIQACEEVLEFMELDVESCLTGRYAQGGGDVCFPCACFAEDKQWLVVYNKVQVLKVFELFHIEADESVSGLMNSRLRQRSATLEDVFFRLTGRSLVE